MELDHKGMEEGATFDRRADYGQENMEEQEQSEQNVVEEQQPNMEVVTVK